MIATQEFVVPRSMPMIFAMFVPVVMCSSTEKVGFQRALSSSRGRDDDERRADHAVVQEIALLQHRDDRPGILVALHLADRLVTMRIEFLAQRGDRLDRELLEDRLKLPGGE